MINKEKKIEIFCPLMKKIKEPESNKATSGRSLMHF